MKSNRIKYVSLQAAITAPGVLGGEVTIDVNNKHKDAQIYYPDSDYPGCVVIYKHGEIVPIPLTNVKCMVTLQDMEKIPEKKKN